MACWRVILHLVAVIAHMALVVVKSHICILKERPDPSLGGALSWSLPYEEICLCDRVLAPVEWPYCSERDDKYENDELWFADNPGPDKTRSRNGGKDALDIFLKRTGYCASSKASDDVTTEKSYDTSMMPPIISPSTTERRAVLPSIAPSTTDIPPSSGASTTASSTMPPGTIPPSTESTQSGSTVAPSTRPSTTESSSVAPTTDASTTDMPQSTAPATADGGTVAPSPAPSTSSSTTERSTSPVDGTTIPVCRDYLGMENGDIPKSNIQASSEYFPAYAARINGTEHWSAKAGAYRPWIQADIGYQTYVYGVVTQGDEGSGPTDDWITSFKVSTFSSPSDIREVFVTEQGGVTEKVFAGNTDPFSLKTTIFPEPVYAQIVRITCLEKGGRYFSIRFEIIGCKA